MPDADPLVALPGVADAVERCRSAIAEIYRHPVNRQDWPRTAAAAAVRAARASAMLDGGSGMLDPNADTVDDPVLAGALRVAAGLGRLAPVWQRAPLQVLAQLHTMAASGVPGVTETGRPADPAAAARLAALGRSITAAAWPAPVLVAVVHGELLAQKPFASADGVVARAAARLTMMSTGLDRRGLTVPEVAHLRSGPRYTELVARYADGAPAGVGAWVIEVCRCLTDGCREARSIAEAAG